MPTFLKFPVFCIFPKKCLIFNDIFAFFIFYDMFFSIFASLFLLQLLRFLSYGCNLFVLWTKKNSDKRILPHRQSFFLIMELFPSCLDPMSMQFYSSLPVLPDHKMHPSLFYHLQQDRAVPK